MSRHLVKLFAEEIDELLERAKSIGVDPGLILMGAYAKHLASNENCNTCRMNAITIAQKYNERVAEFNESRNQDRARSCKLDPSRAGD